jgi:hypothetical protein
LVLFERLLMDNATARRPHKSPAHTVKDHGSRPQRLPLTPPPSIPPEGAAHHTAVFVVVNTSSLPFHPFVRLVAAHPGGPLRHRATGAGAVEGRAFCTPEAGLKSPSVCLRDALRSLRFARGPRARGAHCAHRRGV